MRSASDALPGRPDGVSSRPIPRSALCYDRGSPTSGGLALQAIQILEFLADGGFHSGHRLAERLGLTRAEVCKHVRVLTELGLPVERVRGRGYRIAGGIELLNAGAIRAGLSAEAGGLLHELKVFPLIDSTNAELARRCVPSPGARVALAERQSAGRGRRGKPWVSPFGGNVYCSVAWTFHAGAESLQGLSLAVGVCLCEAMESLGVSDLALKWPNDVLRSRGKLAGVLVDVMGDPSGRCTAIIGTGINMRMPDDAAHGIDQRWSDLADHGLSRNAFVVAYLDRLLPLLEAYEREGFGSWQERWQARDAFRGRDVVIESAGRAQAGVAAGVDERGALLLRTASGVSPVHGGEVSLREAA